MGPASTMTPASGIATAPPAPAWPSAGGELASSPPVVICPPLPPIPVLVELPPDPPVPGDPEEPALPAAPGALSPLSPHAASTSAAAANARRLLEERKRTRRLTTVEAIARSVDTQGAKNGQVGTGHIPVVLAVVAARVELAAC